MIPGPRTEIRSLGSSLYVSYPSADLSWDISILTSAWHRRGHWQWRENISKHIHDRLYVVQTKRDKVAKRCEKSSHSPRFSCTVIRDLKLYLVHPFLESSIILFRLWVLTHCRLCGQLESYLGKCIFYRRRPSDVTRYQWLEKRVGVTRGC
ncbi:hypothetical protein BDN67DRAFT_352639 [Paxillus ammoniavirescens]|nr:hypothetical protein BDN67DRAFT_352639 [Paxillus ammoniavirescens]